MERIVLSFILGVLTTITFGILGNYDYQADCEIALEKQKHHYHQMLQDTHKLYNIKLQQPNTICLDAEITTREILWHIEKLCKDNPLVTTDAEVHIP